MKVVLDPRQDAASETGAETGVEAGG